MITSNTLEKAIKFAVKAHRGQKRKGDKRPYIMHPISVMTTLYSIKESDNLYLLAAAAVLHDTVEDCGISLKKIAKKFGHSVAALVGELTLNKDEYSRVGKTAYLCEEVVKMSSYALCIKLCDRLDNVRDMKKMDEEFKIKYKIETVAIINAIHAKRKNVTDTHSKIIKLIEEAISEIKLPTISA